jgi:LPS export ABC transporter protein LptC
MIKVFRGHITHTHILLAVLSGCFFVGSCVNDENEVRHLFSKKTGVDEATGLDSYMSQGGKMKARLTAPRMLRYLEDTLPRVEFPNTLHVDFYDDSLKIESKLDARYARYYESQNKIFLKDSVQVYNIQGDTLHCMELWWDQTQQKFYTDKAVRIHRKDMIMIGIGLTAPQDFTSFEMYKVSNSIIRIPASQFPD